MTTKVIAGQIANTAIYELKDNNPYIGQLPIVDARNAIAKRKGITHTDMIYES